MNSENSWAEAQLVREIQSWSETPRSSGWKPNSFRRARSQLRCTSSAAARVFHACRSASDASGRLSAAQRKASRAWISANAAARRRSPTPSAVWIERGASAWAPLSTAMAAACMAPTLAAQTPCTDSVSMGGAAISPWIMLAKPGISASPPEDPLDRKPISESFLPARARVSSIAPAAMRALLNMWVKGLDSPEPSTNSDSVANWS